MKIVTAGLIFCQEKILIAQRKKGKALELLWEFPGGKQEEGESLEACLKREIKEEFGKDIEIERFFDQSVYEYPGGAICLKAFFCKSADKNIPFLDSHEQCRWISLNELPEYEFCPADVPLVTRLSSCGFCR